jgi:hypothetical protein
MYTIDVKVSEEPQLQLTGPVGAAVGLGLALATVLPLLLLSELAGMQFLAVQLGFVAAVYFGFAIADGRVRSLLTEVPVAGVFLAVGAGALWADSPLLLAAGYAAHAVWDVLHHPRAVHTEVRGWYPPFCVVYDVIVAAFVLAWLPLGGTG